MTKRNDSRLNTHQRLQLQGWRANCDIQVVIDHYACVEYLTKYAAKGKPRSPMLKQAFNSIVQNVDSDTDPHRAIKKIVMKSLGERDYAAQETMHHLLSLKLHSSSFKVMPVSLNGSRRVRNTAEEGESCTNYSLLDVYANLGVLSPFTIKLKMYFQQLCLVKMNWDEELDEPIRREWNILVEELSQLNIVSLPRCYFAITIQPISIQVHGFSNASKRAYAAVTYLRTVYENGQIDLK